MDGFVGEADPEQYRLQLLSAGLSGGCPHGNDVFQLLGDGYSLRNHLVHLRLGRSFVGQNEGLSEQPQRRSIKVQIPSLRQQSEELETSVSCERILSELSLNRLTSIALRVAVREYQDSWDRRCRMLFCCVGASDRQQVCAPTVRPSFSLNFLHFFLQRTHSQRLQNFCRNSSGI